MLAPSGESASSKIVPPAKPLLPSPVSIAPCCRVIFCASRVILPDAPIELSLRCAVALVALATTRLDTVTLDDRVILSSACKVRLPAFQLVPPPEVPPSAFAPSLRSKSAEITIFWGSIRISPCGPFSELAERLPPASATVSRAENSTNPPAPLVLALLVLAPLALAPLVLALALIAAPLLRVDVPCAITTTEPASPPPAALAVTDAPAPSVISPSASNWIEPASPPLWPSALTSPVMIISSSAASLVSGTALPSRDIIDVCELPGERLTRLSMATTARAPD